MIMLSLPVPVGKPGLIVLGAGFVAFVAALLVVRRGRDEPAAGRQRALKSWIGIVVQSLGIAATGMGPILAGLAAGSALAIGEAAIVALLMAAAVGLFLWSVRTMGRNWSLEARTRADHSLVTSGPFAVIRHPIYLALFLVMLAIALALGHYRQLIVGVPIFALGTWLRVRAEEKLLAQAFGPAYADYAAQVKRFVPSLF